MEEKWYKLFTKMPTIIFILSMITYFVLGIVEAEAGIIFWDLETGFGCWIV